VSGYPKTKSEVVEPHHGVVDEVRRLIEALPRRRARAVAGSERGRRDPQAVRPRRAKRDDPTAGFAAARTRGGDFKDALFSVSTPICTIFRNQGMAVDWQLYLVIV